MPGNLTRRWSDQAIERSGAALKQAFHLRLARVARAFCTETRRQANGDYLVDPITLHGLRHAAEESTDRLTTRETPVNPDSPDVRHLRLARLALDVCGSAKRRTERTYTLRSATFSALCRAADESFDMLTEA